MLPTADISAAARPSLLRAARRVATAVTRLPRRQALLRQRRADRAVIAASRLFDPSWYAARAMADEPGADAAAHYLWRGAPAGQAPHPLFDAAWYSTRAQDLGLEDPWAHYLRVGAAADAHPHPLFDTDYYLQQTPEASGWALAHYMALRPGDLRSPAPMFDPAFYGAGLTAYAERGAPADADPHPRFDAAWYRRTHLAHAPRQACLAHWIRIGQAAGLPTQPAAHAA